MAEHRYDPTCNCDPCFTIWRAEAEAEKAAAHLRGEQRRKERTELWEALLAHFGGDR